VIRQKSTTDDLCELYKMCDRQYVATSDNRMSGIFSPRPPEVIDAFKRKKGIKKPYFLVVGARYGYKNYGIFWDVRLYTHLQAYLSDA
jgi:hypothetical protein